MSELLTDWVTDFNGKTAPPWRRQPVPKEDKISNWKSTSLFRKTTPPCGIQPLHLEDNRIQLCDGEALLMIYQFQFINIKRYIDLRWLFDDRWYIHIRWSCFPYFSFHFNGMDQNGRYNITKVAAVIWNISPNVRRDAVLAGQVKWS